MVRSLLQPVRLKMPVEAKKLWKMATMEKFGELEMFHCCGAERAEEAEEERVGMKRADLGRNGKGLAKILAEKDLLGVKWADSTLKRTKDCLYQHYSIQGSALIFTLPTMIPGQNPTGSLIS